MKPEQIEALAERCAAGITWLVDNDPVGAFYFWMLGKITPSDPMPGQDPETRAAYRDWFKQWLRWRALDRELDLAEGRKPEPWPQAPWNG